MVEGQDIKYLNIPIEIMKDLIKQSIDKNEPVYFDNAETVDFLEDVNDENDS